jgi:hypothetical protein
MQRNVFASGKSCCTLAACSMLANVCIAATWGEREEGLTEGEEEEFTEDEEEKKLAEEEKADLAKPFGWETEGDWFGVETGMFFPAFAFHGLLPQGLDFSSVPSPSPNFFLPSLSRTSLPTTFHSELVASASFEPGRDQHYQPRTAHFSLAFASSECFDSFIFPSSNTWRFDRFATDH